MSKYTTELRYLVEMNFDLGLKDYPIFDELYRKPLNDKIIEHYSFREIGFETAELFKRFLNRTMNEIMPYYNQLYKSELLKFTPLASKQIIEKYVKDNEANAHQTGNGTQSTISTGTNDARSVFSETPQGLLSMSNIETDLYASSASIDKSSGTSDTSSDNTTTTTADSVGKETFTRDITGIEGDPSELLKNFRSTFLNIDMLIIDELNSLFMGIW